MMLEMDVSLSFEMICCARCSFAVFSLLSPSYVGQEVDIIDLIYMPVGDFDEAPTGGEKLFILEGLDEMRRDPINLT